MDFKQFLIEEQEDKLLENETSYRKRGFILKDGKFVDLEKMNIDHSVYTLKYSGTNNTNVIMDQGGIRLLWWRIGSDYQNAFHYRKDRVSTNAKKTMKEFVEDTILYGGSVAFEVFESDEEGESNYTEIYDLDDALNFIRKN